MQSPEARDLARALRISVWYARHASRGIPGNEQAARACFRYLEKSYRYWGLRGRSCSLVASPGGVVPCSCASFCVPPSLPGGLGSWAVVYVCHAHQHRLRGYSVTADLHGLVARGLVPWRRPPLAGDAPTRRAAQGES
jgi:hypothetical protein